MAESLVADCQSPPVSLAPAAHRCAIREVVFRPLLVDGALAERQDGFVMYVCADRSHSGDLLRRFQDPSDGGRSFSVQMRFTIAHEIAHTFFYELRGNKPTPRVVGNHYRRLLSLERECNRGGATLLLPTSLLKLELDRPELDVYCPSSLRRIALRFRVSVETLIHRLDPLGRWTTRPGAIWLVVREDDGRLRIKAARVNVMSGKYRSARGEDPASICYDPRLLLYGGRENMVVRNGWVLRCQAANRSSNAFVFSTCLDDGSVPRIPTRRHCYQLTNLSMSSVSKEWALFGKRA